MFIELPVSIGEGLDKLSILNIKLFKIKNLEKKNEVQLEYDILHNNLSQIIKDIPILYKQLENINLIIWDLMDDLRDCNFDNHITYNILCKKCIDYNDIRFRIKNKINLTINSVIKEQKSYKLNTLVLHTDIINQSNLHCFIKSSHFFSLLYDHLVIFVNQINLNTIQLEQIQVDIVCSDKIENYFKDRITIVIKAEHWIGLISNENQIIQHVNPPSELLNSLFI